VRFLADENFPRTGLAALRERGYDVFSIAESDPGLSDELVAAICDREERILLTFDKDFGELVSGAVCRLGLLLSYCVSCRSRAYWWTLFIRSSRREF
jgi:predicted nuclease of predicted toxin-antitoxin system